MNYTFFHMSNSGHIKKLTTHTVFTYKPRYCFYLKRAGYYPEIAVFDSASKLITVHHESLTSQLVIERSEKVVRDWLKKNAPTFVKNKAYLIINSSPVDDKNFVVDFNKYDEKEISYDLLELIRGKDKPASVIMVCTDEDVPALFYNYTTSVDMDSVLLTELFKDLSYTQGVPATGVGTNFMSEYLVEYYELHPNGTKNSIYLEELKNSDYVFPTHVTTEAIQAHYMENEMEDKYYQAVSSIVDEPVLSEILYTNGLLNVRERYIVDNDINLLHFDFVIATPNLLYIYALVESQDALIGTMQYLNDVLGASVLQKDDYTIIRMDKNSMDILKRQEKNYVSL